jgi:predicted  nucleic acid-binding Zn-ribbon protein
MRTSDSATKKDLKDLEQRLKKDFKGLRSDFADEITALHSKMDRKFDGLYDSLVGWKSEIHIGEDRIMKELKSIREEQAAIHENYKRLDSKVEHHEGYIVKADKKLKISFERA